MTTYKRVRNIQHDDNPGTIELEREMEAKDDMYSVHFTYDGVAVFKWIGSASGHVDALDQARQADPRYAAFEVTTYKGIVR